MALKLRWHPGTQAADMQQPIMLGPPMHSVLTLRVAPNIAAFYQSHLPSRETLTRPLLGAVHAAGLHAHGHRRGVLAAEQAARHAHMHDSAMICIGNVRHAELEGMLDCVCT